jgi:hypothetical protein
MGEYVIICGMIWINTCYGAEFYAVELAVGAVVVVVAGSTSSGDNGSETFSSANAGAGKSSSSSSIISATGSD